MGSVGYEVCAMYAVLRCVLCGGVLCGGVYCSMKYQRRLEPR